MYIPNLQPLVDALFQNNDADESNSIHELVHAFESKSLWPRRLYDSGDAKNLIRPYALKAWGMVVDEFYLVTGLPRELLPSSSNPQTMSPPNEHILAHRPI